MGASPAPTCIVRYQTIIKFSTRALCENRLWHSMTAWVVKVYNSPKLCGNFCPHKACANCGIIIPSNKGWGNAGCFTKQSNTRKKGCAIHFVEWQINFIKTSNGHLLLKVVFHCRSSSTTGHLPPKVVFWPSLRNYCPGCVGFWISRT